MLADGDEEELARAQVYIAKAKEAIKSRDRSVPEIER
jgi:hypothetical protein